MDWLADGPVIRTGLFEPKKGEPLKRNPITKSPPAGNERKLIVTSKWYTPASGAVKVPVALSKVLCVSKNSAWGNVIGVVEACGMFCKVAKMPANPVRGFAKLSQV